MAELAVSACEEVVDPPESGRDTHDPAVVEGGSGGLMRDELVYERDFSNWNHRNVPRALVDLDDLLIKFGEIHGELPRHRADIRKLDEDELRNLLDDLDEQETAMWRYFRGIRGSIRLAVGRKAHARRERARRARRSGRSLNSLQVAALEALKSLNKASG